MFDFLRFLSLLLSSLASIVLSLFMTEVFAFEGELKEMFWTESYEPEFRQLVHSDLCKSRCHSRKSNLICLDSFHLV